MFRLARAVREVFTEPFTSDPALALLSVEQRERLRRVALLRLVVTCLVAVQVLAISIALLNRAPAGAVATQMLILGLGLLCLALGATGFASLLGALYIYGPMLLIAVTVLQNPGGLDVRALLLLTTSPVFILITGLLLPRRVIWLSLMLALAVDIGAVATLPLAPGLPDTLATGEPLRVLAGGLLGVGCLLTALLAWVFARSARAGIDSVGRAFERERELTALKDQFITYANHELRTPVMALYNNLEILELLGEQGDPAEREHIVQQALSAGGVVIRLLRSVLDTSMLEAQAPRIELRAVEVAPLVRAVLETYDPREVGEPSVESGFYESRIVTLAIPDALVVWADEGRMRQILVNLLSNALKYSASGSPININASVVDDVQRHRQFGQQSDGVAPEVARMVRVSIHDQGLGVPPRDVSKLFNRFVRLERDIAGTVRGTGIGLYLCRVLVEAMGGRIWVESSGVPGEGSTFSITLPLAASTEPTAPTASAPAFAGVRQMPREGEVQ
jgi:signal transduction histidine kinase